MAGNTRLLEQVSRLPKAVGPSNHALPRLSLSGFLFEQEYAWQTLSFERFCDLANRAGYSGIELRNTQINLETSGHQQRVMRSMVRDKGLCVTCLTARNLPVNVPAKRDDLLRRYLALCQNMGCPLLKLSGPEAWVYHACEIASDYGVVLACNTHINGPLETAADTVKFLYRIDHPGLGILYDPMHLAICGDDVLNAFDLLFPRVCNVLVQCVRHAHHHEPVVFDYKGQRFTKTRIDQRPLGDWPALFRQLCRRRYTGWMTVVENNWPPDQQEGVAIATANYMRSLWEKVSLCNESS